MNDFKVNDLPSFQKIEKVSSRSRGVQFFYFDLFTFRFYLHNNFSPRSVKELMGLCIGLSTNGTGSMLHSKRFVWNGTSQVLDVLKWSEMTGSCILDPEIFFVNERDWIMRCIALLFIRSTTGFSFVCWTQAELSSAPVVDVYWRHLHWCSLSFISVKPKAFHQQRCVKSRSLRTWNIIQLYNFLMSLLLGVAFTWCLNTSTWTLRNFLTAKKLSLHRN